MQLQVRIAVSGSSCAAHVMFVGPTATRRVSVSADICGHIVADICGHIVAAALDVIIVTKE